LVAPGGLGWSFVESFFRGVEELSLTASPSY
jgi:hypothetical protein